MLEGLEISEVLLSNLEFSARIDSEYYRPSLLKYEKLIKSKDSSALKNISDFLIGPFGSAFTVDNYVDINDYRYIRGKDVKPLKLKDDDNVYIPKEDYKRLSKYALRENDILVSVVGTLGNAALVTKKDLPAIFSCKSTVLRPSAINPAYLLVYINCKYGNQLLKRKERGAIQKGFNLGDLESLEIFIPSASFQNYINSVFRESLSKIENSKSIYSQAEKLLLQELNLKNFQPSQESVNIKRFSESFGCSGRLDAEYYQVKYEEIENKLKLGEHSVLGDETLQIDTGEYSPSYLSKNDSENLVFYIRSTNIKQGQIESDNNFYVPRDNFTKIAEKGDILTARVGSVGIFGEVREQLQGSIYSDNILCFRLPDGFIPSVYTLLFNTKYYFELVDKLARGSVQQRLNQETLKSLIIPIIPICKQQEIAHLIEKSFALKKQSEQLLDIAKQGVEMAIEQDEQTALEWINEQTKAAVIKR